MKVFSLLEINTFTRRAIALNFSESVWITAEIGQVSVSKAQHVYLSLLEKEDTAIVAQMDAVIWSDVYRRLQYQLGGGADGILQAGHAVKIKGRLDFHERYGLKITIEDIDTQYSFGALALQRRQYLLKLQSLDLIERNSRQTLALVPQRLAVISGENAAGLQDFRAHLEEHKSGYKFEITFFQAAVQGILAEKEIPKQLALIARHAHLYDCVCIIRGGGAKLDLLAFDSWPVCEAVATSPLPVLVGIGHDIDATLTDVVAHTSVKTPTALADFLIAQLETFEHNIQNMALWIKNKAAECLHTEGVRLSDYQQRLRQTTQMQLFRNQQYLSQAQQNVAQKWAHKKQYAHIEIKNAEKLLELMRLETALKRGFTVVSKEEKTIASIEQLDKNDSIHIRFKDGIVHSSITDIISNTVKHP